MQHQLSAGKLTFPAFTFLFIEILIEKVTVMFHSSIP